MNKGFDEKEYWDRRYQTRGLERVGSSSGTQTIGGAGRLNHWLYRLREEALVRALNSHAVDLPAIRVLDVGCGSGYWTEFYHRAGVKDYCGIDVSTVAVDSLTKEFPQLQFHCADLGAAEIPLEGTFDLINAFDILYHIVDDEKFQNALKHLGSLAAPGALLIITDYFDDRQPISAAHVRHRSLPQYRESLESVGFEIVSLRPVFYYLGRNVGVTAKDVNHSWATNYLLAPFYFRGWFSSVLYQLDRLVLPSVRDDDPRAKTKLLAARRVP